MSIGALSLAVTAHRALRESGGFTLSPEDGTQPAGGYAVAVYPEAEEVIPDPLKVSEILSYIVRWAKVLYNDTRAHLGGWVSEGKVYLDISAVFTDLDEALEVARANGQLAIWDLGRSEEIAA